MGAGKMNRRRVRRAKANSRSVHYRNLQKNTTEGLIGDGPLSGIYKKPVLVTRRIGSQ
jgi:hypothetical protein